MPHVRRRPVEARRVTAEDLLELAAAQGTPITRRLITDWVSLGLLDAPAKRSVGYRGSLPGDWSPLQGDLLGLMVRTRYQGAHIGALCNLPVAAWLIWGDRWVPLRQARRALTTWGASSALGKRDVARRVIDEVLPHIADPASSLASRRKLKDHLVWAIQRAEHVDKDQLGLSFKEVVDPRDQGPHGPMGAQLRPEAVLALLRIVVQVLFSPAGLSDDPFLAARLLYRMGNVFSRQQFASSNSDHDVLTILEDKILNEPLNRTCLDFLPLLGLVVAAGATRESS